MSDERDIIRIDGSVTKPISVEEAKTLAGPELTREQEKAMLISVLERGWTNERLKVDLPPDLHGEWIARDASSVMRAQRLGFRNGTEYAKEKALHSDGADLGVGDCIFMICSKERKKLIDEVKTELIRRRNEPVAKKKGNVQEEETQFTKDVDSRLGMPVIEESSTTKVNKADIEAALTSK